ncbi:MAG: DUF1761 domain-containing protein [Bacteroidetes bacterium]|nr:DUF1761 domain-containing protein [Bacteroidota bacterium]
MQFHFYIPFIAALIPLFIGFIWYNPKVFGNAWMKASNTPVPEAGKGPNMAIVFSLCYVFGLLVAFALMSLTVHQMSVFSILANEPGMGDPNSEVMQLMSGFYAKYGNNFRTFKHGALHGTLAGIMIALPIIGTSALFEGRKFKYIAISAGYWIVSMALMGGVICAFL